MYIFQSLVKENNYETVAFLKSILNCNGFKMYSRLLGEEKAILNKYKFIYLIDEVNNKLEVLYFRNNNQNNNLNYFIKFDISNGYPFKQPQLYFKNNKDLLIEFCKASKDPVIKKSLNKKNISCLCKLLYPRRGNWNATIRLETVANKYLNVIKFILRCYSKYWLEKALNNTKLPSEIIDLILDYYDEFDCNLKLNILYY